MKTSHGITVVVEIAEGNRYRLHSSYGYAGVIEGEVQVQDLVPYDQLPEDKKSTADAHIDGDLSLHEPGEIDREELEDSNWVVYKYADKDMDKAAQEGVDSDGVDVMEIGMFLDHTTVL